MGDARLWTGGRIFTGKRYAEALLVDGGEVVAAGTESAVRRMAPTGTEAIPLEGRLMLPGLIDAHLHLSDLARFRSGLDLTEVRGPDDLEHRVRTWVEGHPGGSVVGRGLDVERSLAGHWPTRSDLDRMTSDRPLVLVHSSGHAAILNSVALTIGEGDSRPPGELEGRIGRAPDGRPNGIVYEEAVRWFTSRIPARLEPDELLRTLDLLASFGLTSVATMNVAPEELVELRSLASDGRFPIRVRVYLRLLRIREFRPADLSPVGMDGSFAVVGTKGFTDGAFGPRTAWLSEPYTDMPDGSGLAVESDDTLADALSAGHALGLAPALHAIGDRAVVRAARLIRPYARRQGAAARIEHAALTPPSALVALDDVRPALVVQPGFVWSDSWLPQRLGAARVRWAYAFRTLTDRGHLLVGSSDAPYDPPDPWRGLRAVVERRDPLGRSANPDPHEALTYEEATRMYGCNAGVALGESALGSLEPGSRADLIVLDTKTLGEAIRLGARTVRETWVGGRRFSAAGEAASGRSP